MDLDFLDISWSNLVRSIIAKFYDVRLWLFHLFKILAALWSWTLVRVNCLQDPTDHYETQLFLLLLVWRRKPVGNNFLRGKLLPALVSQYLSGNEGVIFQLSVSNFHLIKTSTTSLQTKIVLGNFIPSIFLQMWSSLAHKSGKIRTNGLLENKCDCGIFV